MIDSNITIRIAKKILPILLLKIRSGNNKKYTPRMKGWSFFDLYIRTKSGYRKYPLVNIDTIGCSHTLNGGCTMCNYELRTSEKKINRTEQFKSSDDALEYIRKKNNGYRTGIYNITTGGSFFDTDEIPEDLRRHILRKISKYKKYNEKIFFSTESRLEYVNEKLLIELRDILGYDSNISIGYGIESTNFLIREACVNKKLPMDFKEKISLLDKYKIIKYAHLIVKPPFVTEQEAIDDIVSSVKDSFINNFADRIVVMTMNSRPLTLIREMEKHNMYELPSIWSIVKIIEDLGPKYCSKINFHGFIVSTNWDKDINVVKGCLKCEKLMFPKLNKFKNITETSWREFITYANGIECECKNEWREKIKRKHQLVLEERIIHYLNELSLILFKKTLKEFL